MDLTFSKVFVDTSLAREYLQKNETLSELYNDYFETSRKFSPYTYDGKVFIKNSSSTEPFEGAWHEGLQSTILNMASKLKQNATLITQLEYYIRNIPIEDTRTQLNLIIQYIQCCSKPGAGDTYFNIFKTNDPLLVFGHQIFNCCRGRTLVSGSKTTAPICHLLTTLLHEAGAKNVLLQFGLLSSYSPGYWSKLYPFKGLSSGTVAVVSDDADIDSAVDKFVAISTQAPWRLWKILVQESVYTQFKDALGWKCKLNKSGSNSPSADAYADVLCSDTLTYNDITFLIDPVELTEEKPSVVVVEAYRTAKEMISLVQQYKARYLSLWTNGIAEINEVTHSTKSPVVWVNNLADFRGPPQVSEAVFSYYYGDRHLIRKCDKVAKLSELSQSWLKLNLEGRRNILYGVLDKCILLDPANKLYTDIRNFLPTCTLKSFVDVGKDYVCVGMSQPKGIMYYDENSIKTFFSVDTFALLLQGNSLIVFKDTESPQHLSDLVVLEQAGVPVAYLDRVSGDFPVFNSSDPTRTQVVWTNSGTIFAN